MSNKRLNPQYNVALMASAGTGKTYNLSLRVVTALMQGGKRQLFDHLGKEVVSHINSSGGGKILCLTFTRKATAEMAQRVHQYLNKLANGEYPATSSEYIAVSEALGVDSFDEIRRRATVARERVLRDSSLLQIRTIDSFTSHIIKQFPFEAGVNPDFKMLSTSADKELNGIAFKNAFTKVSSNKYTDLFFRYIHWADQQPFTFIDHLTNDIDWVVKNSVVLRSLLYSDWALSFNYLTALMDSLMENTTEAKLVTVEVAKLFDENRKSLKAHITKRCEKLLSFADNKSSWDEFLKACDGIEPERICLKGAELPQYLPVYSKLLHCLHTHVELSSKLEVAILLHMSVLVQKELDDLKRSKNSLNFNDVLRLVYNIMHSVDCPVNPDYLYFRLDGRLEHILVDEFQDTSAVQWSIIEPLADESMGGLAQNDKAGSFFCVGDSKQTVYRFRGSNPNFSNSVVQRYIDRGLMSREYLDKNWRSDKNIIRFVNELFMEADNFLKSEVGAEGSFDFTIQNAASQNEGYVSVRKVDEKADGKECRLEELGKIFDELISKGWHNSDVAVIVTKQEFGFTVQQYLQNEKKIPAHVGFTEPLTNRPAYKIVVALVRYIYTRNNFHLVEFLLTPPEAIPRNRISSERQLFRYKRLLDSFLDKNIGKTVCQIVSDIGRRFSLISRLKDDSDFYLLWELVTANLATVTNPLQFCMSLENLASSANVSVSYADGGSVTIMTVHGAKGLEFPVVIVYDIDDAFSIHSSTRYFIDSPFLDDQPTQIYRYLNATKLQFATEDYSKALNREKGLDRYEKINKLYVAVTRAAKVLYYIASTSKTNSVDHYVLDKFPDGIEYGILSENKKITVENKQQERLTDQEYLCKRVLYADLSKDKVVAKKYAENILPKMGIHHIEEERFRNYIDKRYKETENQNDTNPYSDTFAKRMLGIFIHEAIYQLHLNPGDDMAISIKNAVEKAYNRYGGYLVVDYRPTALEMLQKLSYEPFWQELLNSEKIYREKQLFHDGGMLILDLYTISKDKAMVVDFKSGEKRATYTQQIQGYMEALSGQYHLPVKGYLVYLNVDGVDIEEVN